MSSVCGTPSLTRAGRELQYSGNADDKTTDLQKPADVRQVDIGYQGGCEELTKDKNHNIASTLKRRERVYLSDGAVTQTMRHQMKYFRCLMCPILFLLVMIFLVASAGLFLTVLIMTGRNVCCSQSVVVPTFATPPGRISDNRFQLTLKWVVCVRDK